MMPSVSNFQKSQKEDVFFTEVLVGEFRAAALFLP